MLEREVTRRPSAYRAWPMRVLLDTTYARRGPSGTGVYIDRLVAALTEEGVEVIEAANERRPAPAGGGVNSARNLAARPALDAGRAAAAGTRGARGRHPPPAAGAGRRRALPAGRHRPRPRLRAPARLLQRPLPALRVAHAPRCRSRRRRRSSASPRRPSRDALARWGLDHAKIVVALHGPGQEPPAVAAGAPSTSSTSATTSRARTSALLLDAHARYRAACRMVAASGAGAGSGGLPLVLAGRATAEQDGVRCDREPDLAELLTARAALVHPSLHEGFGLTRARGDARGRPGARRPLAGPRRDLRRRRALLSIRTTSATSPSSSHRSSRRGRCATSSRAAAATRAADFSWQAAARAHLAAYRLATTR